MADNPEVQGAQPDQPQPPAAPAPVQYSPKPVDGPVAHANEEEDMLFGPTHRPEEHVTTGGYVAGQTVSTPPDGMSHWYAALRQASRDPDAPPRIKELWNLTNHLMNTRDAAGDRVDLLPAANGDTPLTGDGPVGGETVPTGV